MLGRFSTIGRWPNSRMMNYSNLSLPAQEALGRLLKRRAARQNLLDFTLFTMPEYQVNWHHRVMAQYIDRWIRKEIRRLMIFAPPRHGKSQQVSRHLPPLILGQNPNARILGCSYGGDLAAMMNRDIQKIIDTPAYYELFPNTTLAGAKSRTAEDANYIRNSEKFEVVGHKGSYRGAGVGGSIVGQGFDFGIIDDPIKSHEEAHSAVIREKTWNWYVSDFLSRGEKNASILVMHTRWHEDDLAGRLLALEGSDWVVLDFPAIMEEGRQTDYDPREVGEPLWPGKYPLEELHRFKKSMPNIVFSALYQQRPVPAGGGMFKRSNFRYFTMEALRSDIVLTVEPEPTGIDSLVSGTEPADVDYMLTLHHENDTKRYLASQCVWFQTADMAAGKGQENDYTAIGTWAVTPQNDMLLVDLYYEKVEIPQQYDVLMQLRHKWGHFIAFQAVEETSAGIGLIQMGRQRGTPFRRLKAKGSKWQRAFAISAMYENFQVYHLQNAPYLATYESNLLLFPNGQHDDDVDQASYAGQVVTEEAVDLIVQNSSPLLCGADVEYSDDEAWDEQLDHTDVSTQDLMGRRIAQILDAEDAEDEEREQYGW